MLDSRTIRNFNTVNAGLTVLQILGNNLLRKAFILSPVAGSMQPASTVTAAAFLKGLSQPWVVPTGVTQVVNIYAWGSGGNSGAAAAGLGGGGGGGGAFATSGPKTVVPGQTWKVDVDAGGGAAHSSATDPVLSVVVNAGSGASGVADVGGAGGAATVGITLNTGGNGDAATALAGVGAGSGGAAGSYSNGGNAVGAAGGGGGGGATLLTYGAGGAGANGTGSGMDGNMGVAPGGGGSGGGDLSANIGLGADGLVVIFYISSVANNGISVDQDQHLVLGQGSLNYLFGQTFPTLVTREQIGDAIRDPWYVISGLANQPVRVTEYSYVPEE